MAKQIDEPMTRERLIILEHDGYKADILPVFDVNHERILAGDGEMSIPLEDVKQFVSGEGRVWVLHAPEWYINETKHLADVEMSTVIRQAVAYQRPGAAMPKPNPFLKLLPWIAAGAFLLLFIFKK